KQFWTIKVLSMKNQQLVKTGLYRYIRHPNYLIVIIEFILIPFLLKAYITMVLFSILNLFVLSKRIKLEEETLINQTDYNEVFSRTSKLVPFLLIL
ncbi:MAG: DUF1295 domain-containing protein, partial [Bacteriovorax sp.]|nr:DUF1295 domain-containing protein [Bacteriovorax sp.]